MQRDFGKKTITGLSTALRTSASAVVVGVSGLVCFATPASAEIVFFDNFQVAGGNNGQPLAGTTPDVVPVGASNWVTNNTSNPRTQGGQVTVTANTANRTAYVLNVPVTPTSEMLIVEFTGVIDPVGSRWIDVNLYDDDVTPTTGANTQLGVRVRAGDTSNTAQLRVNNLLVTGASVDVDLGPQPFVLTYNASTNTASLTVGTTVVADNADLGTFTPVIDGVGMNFQVPVGGAFGNLQPRVDTLQVEIIPEPATLGLVLASGFLILGRGQRASG
ncbi:MAG: hypothetical protein AAF823_08200 [Planctomycetota bacterium]